MGLPWFVGPGIYTPARKKRFGESSFPFCSISLFDFPDKEPIRIHGKWSGGGLPESSWEFEGDVYNFAFPLRLVIYRFRRP